MAEAPRTKRKAPAADTNTVGGYAARLSSYPNKGVTGLPESEDTPRRLERKLSRLAELFREARSVVFLTGAGISTSAGIPDFRGPRGIWTLEDEAKAAKGRGKKRKPLPKKEVAATIDAGTNGASFESAVPTPTHMALCALAALDKVKFLATQNVDGLHVRSGFPRAKLGVLHGCVFTEKCENCGAEYVRDHDLGGISFRPTGRACGKCGGRLLDTVLDWDDGLPDSEWLPAEEHFEGADLAITLGTSLRIVPAGELPLRAERTVIVNLQATPYDNHAKVDTVIRARVDMVMDSLLGSLGMSIPAPPARLVSDALADEVEATQPPAEDDGAAEGDAAEDDAAEEAVDASGGLLPDLGTQVSTAAWQKITL